MSQETQPIRIETGEEVAFELMKFIAEKENRQLSTEEIRDYSLNVPQQFMKVRENNL
jgi:hypothetical protein